jgi:hypothetical protein
MTSSYTTARAHSMSHPKTARLSSRSCGVSDRRRCGSEHQFEKLGLPGLEQIRYAKGQTFGVEIELTRPVRRPVINRKWIRIGRHLIDALKHQVTSAVHPVPLKYHENREVDDPSRWYVTFDRTVGFEIVSPILVDRQGFLELQRACTAISFLVADNPWGVGIDHRAGLHITLATRPSAEKRLCGLVRGVQRLEPGLFTLVAPSRLFRFDGHFYDLCRPNQTCTPLRALHPPVNYLDFMMNSDLQSARYFSLNVCPAFGIEPLLEVRMHHGTTDFRKMAIWVALWMHIVHRSQFTWKGEGISGAVFDGDRRLAPQEAKLEDLFPLLVREGIYLEPQLVKLLKERRRELRPYWERVLPNRVRSWAAAGWYRQPLEIAFPRSLAASTSDRPPANDGSEFRRVAGRAIAFR